MATHLEDTHRRDEAPRSRSRRGRWESLVVAFAATVAAAACRHGPRAGSTCRVPDQLACTAADHAVVCDTGTWAEVPCRGHRGCFRRGDIDECDDTIARDGDPCPRNPPLDYACTGDGSRALVCRSGRFSLWRSCRGPDQCRIVDGGSLQCDTTLGRVGDPCSQQGTYSCSVEHDAMLVCDGKTLGAASSCRGPRGCRIERDARKVDCDDSVAREGDPCDQPKRIACSLDRKAELVCAGGAYAKKRDCRRTDCRLEDTELFCD